MNNRNLIAIFAIVGLASAGCRDRTIEQSPGEVLARDSSLASEIRQADTSAFAADAMAFDPDSALPPVNAKGKSAPSRAAASPTAASPTATASPAATAPPATRAPMRPAPATIHPDPIPTHRLPAAPPRARPTKARVDPVAAEILGKVPGAPLPRR